MPTAPKISSEKKAKLRQEVLEAIGSPDGEEIKPAVKIPKSESVTPPPVISSPPKPVEDIKEPPKIQIKKVKKPAAVKKQKPSKPIAPLKPKTAKSQPIKKQSKKSLPAPAMEKSFKRAPVKLEMPKMILPPKAKNKVRAIAALLIIILVVIVGIIGLDVFGMYFWGLSDAASAKVARILNLPAGAINNETIKMADYLDDLQLLKTALSNDREGADGVLASGSSLKDKIFNRQFAIVLINSQLKKYNQTVSEQDIAGEMNKIMGQFETEQQAEQSIKQLYNLTLNQFKEKILLPLVAKDKLQNSVLNDDNAEINKAAKTKAEAILKLALEPNADFGGLAKAYTQDESGINIGGDLGIVSKGELAPEIEEALFALPENTVYNQLIKNSFGYHIIKANKILISETTGVKTVKAQHILIRVSVDEYLKDLMDRAQIKKFIK